MSMGERFLHLFLSLLLVATPGGEVGPLALCVTRQVREAFTAQEVFTEALSDGFCRTHG